MKAVLAAAALLVPALAFANGGDSQVRLLSRLHHEANLRIGVGHTVEWRGESKQVKAFAATMTADQQHLDEAVLDYVRANRLALDEQPAGVKAPGLDGLTGSQLDRRFLIYVSDTAGELINALEAASDVGDGQYRRVINRALAMYREHRHAADALLREVPST